MYAPRVFISMIGVLIAFAVSAYVISGSVFTTVIQTIICAVLIQAGYFVCILYLVRRERLVSEPGRTSDLAAARNRDGIKRDEIRGDASHNLPARDI